MGGECNTYGKMRNAYKIIVGKSEGKIPLRRPRRRWEDITEVDLKETVIVLLGFNRSVQSKTCVQNLA
jgi:hypothetical protein